MKAFLKTLIDCLILSMIFLYISVTHNDCIQWLYVLSPFWILALIILIELVENILLITFHFFRGIIITKKKNTTENKDAEK